MLIVYDSLTGNVERFVNKTEFPSQKIYPGLKVNTFFILVSYSIGFGEIPETTVQFLKSNYKFLKGVAVSGNKNWGNNFGKSGKTISEMYKVPLILSFELSGSNEDIFIFKREVLHIVNSILR
jgi:protein involved in ribonucleotide reduction